VEVLLRYVSKKTELQKTIDAYHARRDMRLGAKNEIRRSIEEYHIRRDARLDAKNIEISTNKSFTKAEKYSKIMPRKINRDADDLSGGRY